MKSERRHELQSNVLLDASIRTFGQIRPYGKSLAAMVILALVLAIIWTGFEGSSPQGAGDAWLNFYHAFGENDAEALQEIAKKNPDTAAGLWSRQLAADIQLAEGSGRIYSDRDEARDALDLAITRYGQVIDAAKEPMLLQRAYFGLGQSHECMAVLASKPELVKRQLEMAQAKYQKLVDQWPQSILALSAKARIEQISTSEAEDFYVWFSEQKPFTPGAGLSGVGGDEPFDTNALQGSPATGRPKLEGGDALLDLDPDAKDEKDATGDAPKESKPESTLEGPELTPPGETPKKAEPAAEKPKTPADSSSEAAKKEDAADEKP